MKKKTSWFRKVKKTKELGEEEPRKRDSNTTTSGRRRMHPGRRISRKPSSLGEESSLSTTTKRDYWLKSYVRL